MWSKSLSFAGSLSAPGDARRFCADELPAALGNRAGTGAAISTAQLIASELVTNSVNAGSNQIDITLRLTGDRLRIVVEDDVPDLPRLHDAAISDDHGRGLPIIDALSVTWGYERLDATKLVWAEFAIGGGATRSDPATSRGASPRLG